MAQKKKASSFDELMNNFNKDHKEEIVHIGMANYDYDRIPFTSPRLNYMTYGGIPVGKITEFFGEEHGGKTTTALDIVANFQAMDERAVLYVDIEHSLDIKWASKLRVDVESLRLVTPTDQGSEEIFQFILDAIDIGDTGLVVIDSLGAMVSTQAMEGSVEDKTFGGISTSLTAFGNKAIGLLTRHNCTLLAINQLRDKIGSMYGGTKTVGGWSWRYLCIARLEFRHGAFLDSNYKELTRGAENPAGQQVNVAMIKNKTCTPNRRVGFYTLMYVDGIDYLYDLVEVAIENDIVNQAGAWFTIVDTETGELLSDKIQGQANVIKFLGDEDNVEVLRRVEELVSNIFEE